MKHIVVYFTDPNENGRPFNDPEYARSYPELGKCIEERGGSLCIARGAASHCGKGAFTHFWEYERGSFIRRNEAIIADVVYNKGEDLSFDDGTNVINVPAFSRLCTQKEETYAKIGTFMPKSELVQNPEELHQTLTKLSAPRIVVKPNDGACGRGVMIDTSTNILAAEHCYPLLVQEFIDTSEGIPGVMKGTHDMRLVIIGGRLAYAEYRKPKSGSLISNVALGGSYYVIPDDMIPKEALDFGMSIDSRFTHIPSRLYTIDMVRSNEGRWYLIELNSSPGLIEQGIVPEYRRYHEFLADHLLWFA